MSLDPTEEGCFSISAQSDLSKLLKRSKLLVVDEATLIDRRNFDKFEATLRDITGCTLPWGGKIVIFCGDFRSSNSKHLSYFRSFLKMLLRFVVFHKYLKGKTGCISCHFPFLPNCNALEQNEDIFCQ